MMWWIAIASAEIVLLSSAVEKQDAKSYEAQCQSALDDSEYSVRKARFYMSGQGYRIRIAVDGAQTLEDAQAVLGKLETVPLNFVIAIDGKEQSQTEPRVTVAPKRIEVEPERIETIPMIQVKEFKRKKTRLVPTVDDVLLHAKDAHQLIVKDWSTTNQESFIFYRKRPQEGSLIHHRFYKAESALRLDITIQKGDGMNSTTVLPDEGEAWVSTDEKKVSRNAIRTRELLARFSSTNILSIPYNIGQDIENGVHWTTMTTVEEVDDKWRLQNYEQQGIVTVDFYQQTWLVASMMVKDGDQQMEYEFLDYRTVDGIGMIPHVIQIYDADQMIEEIQVEDLDVSNIPAQSIFKTKTSN